MCPELGAVAWEYKSNEGGGGRGEGSAKQMLHISISVEHCLSNNFPKT